MKRALLLLFFLGILSTCQYTFSQGWVLQVEIDINHGNCAIEKLTSASASFAGSSGSSSTSSGSRTSIILTGTGTGSVSGTLNVSASGDCVQSYDPQNPVSSFSASYSKSHTLSDCSPPPIFYDSYKSGDISNVGGSLNFFPRLVISTLQQVCGSVSLSSNICSGGYAYRWEIAENFSGPWKPIDGKSEASISLTPDELASLGLNDPYGRKYFRVTGRTGTTSEVVSIDIYYPRPTATFVNSHPKCHGSSDGEIQVNITSADPGKIDDFVVTIYNRSNPDDVLGTDHVVNNSFSYTINSLSSKTYGIKVQNATDIGMLGSCYTTYEDVNGSLTLINPDPVTLSFDTTKFNGYAITCKNAATGEITVIPSGGTPPFKNYSWNTGAAAQKITGLSASTYTVTLTDNNNCPAGKSVTIHEPPLLTVALISTGGKDNYDVSCWNKTDGAISSTVTGGVTSMSYSYLWSTTAISSSISGVGTGNYSLTVTDANSCTVNDNITLTAPAPIDFTIAQLTDLKCNGDKTAVLEAQGVNNTIGVVSYQWSSGEVTPDIVDKGAGAYSLTISDQQGCSTTKSKEIIDPPAHSVSVTAQSNFNGSHIKCNGEDNGELAALVKDPNNNVVTAQYYEWFKNGTSYEEGLTKTSIQQLNEASYKVVITYNTQCKAESSIFFLNDPDPVEIDVQPTTNFNGQPISCSGEADANLKALVTGGTGSYTYSWNTGSTISTVSGVGAGTYTVDVFDVNGCPGSGELVINNPPPVQALILSSSNYSGYGVSCNGLSDGSITAGGSGGTGVYSYSWSNEKNTATINGLPAGSYTVQVSDNNGCSDAIEKTITTPDPLTLEFSGITNISCFEGSDGEIVLLSTGGAGQNQYSKDNGATWQSSEIFNGLVIGSYTLRVRDSNGCLNNTSTTLTEPPKIEISFADIEPAYCSNAVGKATAIVTGGVESYQYEWRNNQNNTIVGTSAIMTNVPAGIYSLFIRDSHDCPAQNSVPITSTDGAKSTYEAESTKCFDSSDGTALITITEGDGPITVQWPDGQTTLHGVNLRGGDHYVLITDGHDCTVVETIHIPAPPALQVNVVQEIIPTCHTFCDGEITLEASGGVGNYTYEWNGKATAHQAQLCAGVYVVIVKDGNSCVLNEAIEFRQPAPIDVVVVKETLPTCKDGCDGALEIIASGGNGGFQYAWTTGESATIRNDICPGTYHVDIVDQKGCTGGKDVMLNNTPPLPLNLGGGVTLCVGQTYLLDAGPDWTSVKWTSNAGLSSTDQKLVVKGAGQYKLEVVNNLGCTAEDIFLLETSYDLLKAKFLLATQALVGDSIVMIDISWPLPEKIIWSYPSTMHVLADQGDVVFGQFNDPGVYEVSLTAHLGECRDRMTKTITILDGEEDAEGGRLGYEDFVTEFSLYPNPNDGSFDVGVELLEEGSIILSVWNTLTSYMVGKVGGDGNKSYRKHFDLRPLSAGVYVLRLDHPKGKEYIRFVVH